MTIKNWFAIRTIYFHGKSAKGKAIYEEKISMYLAADPDEARRLAEDDATQYVELNDRFIQLKTYEIFVLGHGESNLDKYEVWSTLLEGPEDMDTFLREKYGKFAVDNQE